MTQLCPDTPPSVKFHTFFLSETFPKYYLNVIWQLLMFGPQPQLAPLTYPGTAVVQWVQLCVWTNHITSTGTAIVYSSQNQEIENLS